MPGYAAAGYAAAGIAAAGIAAAGIASESPRDRQPKTRLAVEGLDPSTSGWPPPSGLWAQHAIHCATPLVYIILK